MPYFTEPRNIELSTLEYLSTQIDANWSGVTVVKTFAQAYSKNINLPIVCVRLLDQSSSRLEIGSNTLDNRYGIAIDIFARSDGQRIDLANFILDKLKDGWVYYIFCYDEKTEILTDQGWKYFKDLDKTEKVATLNLNTYKLEYQKPLNYFVFDYEGDMFEVKSNFVDLLVTLNHKMVISFRKRKGKKFEFVAAKKILNRAVHYLKSCKWEGKEVSFFYLPGIEYYISQYDLNKRKVIKKKKIIKPKKINMNDWLKFLGWYLSEGFYYENQKLCYVEIAQSEKANSENYNKIIKLLDKLGWHYLKVKKTNGYSESIRISNKQLAHYLKQFGKSKDKFIPKEFKNLSKNQLLILLKTLISGDGCKLGGYLNSFSYLTTSKRLAGDVQEIALKCGYSADIYKREYQRKNFRKTVIYQVSIKSKRGKEPIVNRKKQQHKLVKYKGKVYSVEVPNHVVLVRRNGKAVFSGNSHKSGDKSQLEKTANGRIEVTDFMENYRIDFAELEVDEKDRFRHFISVRVRKS